jgi:uncharacterized protein (DUF697 family)
MVEVYTPVAEKEGQARKIVRKYMWFSMGVSLLPFPVLDTAGILALQLRMLQTLSEPYNVPFSTALGKKVISALLGSVVPASLSSPVMDALKMVPGLGALAGLTMTISLNL